MAGRSEIRKLARVALSQAVSAGGSATLVQHSLLRALQLYALTEVPDGHAAEVDDGPMLHPGHAARRKGIEADEVRRAFKLARRRQGWEAELAELDDLIDTRIWPAVEALLRDGPVIARDRIEVMLEEQLLEFRPGNVRVKAGPPAQGTLKNYTDQLQKLMRAFVSVRDERSDIPELAQWTAIPEIDVPDAPDGTYNPQAPPFQMVRAAFGQLDSDVRQILGVETLEEEVQLLGNLSSLSRWKFWNLVAPAVKPARRRAVAATITVTGLRRGAVVRLKRTDFIEDYAGPAPDYRTGYALVARPRKKLNRYIERPKPLPDDVGWFIKAYLLIEDEIVRRLLAGDHPRSKKPPKWHKEGAKPTRIGSGEAPLFVGTPGRAAAYGEEALGHLLSGKTRSGPRRGRPALVSRQGPLPEGVEEEQRPYIGYTPQEYRHLTYQLALRAGAIWIEDHPGHEGALLQPRYFAHALLDHKNIDGALGDIYGDRGDRVREVLTGRAIEGVWELIRGDVGARKRPDVEAYRQSLFDLRDVEADLHQVAKAQDSLVSRGAVSAPSLPVGASVEEKLDFLIEQAKELREIALEGHGLTHRAIQLAEQRAVLVKRLDVLRFDEMTWERIPDTEPEGAERVDLETLEAKALGHAVLPAATTPKPVRDWLTVTEFCQVADISRSTATRWLRGEHLPPNATERPWDADLIAVDDSQETRYRRVWIPGVAPMFYSTRLMQERRDEFLARWPLEQGWSDSEGEPLERCLTPLELPDRIRRLVRRRDANAA